jgi:membrane protein DedA with SNARE-associated domain
VHALLDWLISLPPLALQVVLGVVAAVENVFPPVPADTVVAFGAFLAARAGHSAAPPFLATWAGNIAGAMLMYWLGRRYGAARLDARLLHGSAAGAERRLQALYGRFGLGALFISRFLPGVRAIVPPFAGALRIPPGRAAVMIGLASGIWYGLITWAAYSVGSSWEDVLTRVAAWGRWVGIVAAVIAVAALAWWFVAQRRRAARGGEP